jgi:adenylate kinase family enzyme
MASMRRIAIVGPPAAGKSTLGHMLGHRLGIEVHHLDALYWQPGAQRTDDAEWRRLHSRLVEGETWIIDGGFTSLLPERFAAADTVVVLDRRPAVCVARVVWRWLVYGFRRAPGMADVSRPHLDRQMLRWIRRYRHDKLPEIFAALGPDVAGRRVHHVRTRRDVRALLDTAARAGSSAPAERRVATRERVGG